MAEKTKSEWILIVAGGILQVPAVRAAHELGYKVVVTDRDPNCACASMADHFVELDTFDAAGHVDFVHHWPYGLAAVFTAGADPIVTVAQAAQAAGCHGLDPAIAGICADKDMTRFELHVENNGRYEVAQPDYIVFQSGDSPAMREIRFESIFGRFADTCAIVKATGSSGSRGHTRLKAGFGKDELLAAVECALNHSVKDTVLVEELLSGTELSVETLWYDGEMIPLNAVERPFIEESAYAIELGHYNPAVLDADDYAAMWDVMRQAGCAVGMNETSGGHILKGDLMLTDDGPKVLELTTRLSGGFDSGWTTPLAHGADYTKGALLLALGEPLERAMPHFAKRWSRHAACLAILRPQQGGIIKKIKGVERASKYAEVILRYDVGDALPALEDCSARVGFVVSSGATPPGARLGALGALSAIELEVE